MVAYSFQQQFVEPILAGTKQQTIRKIAGKRHARAGEMVQLYTGLRTSSARLIGSGMCIGAEPITISLSRKGAVVVVGGRVFGLLSGIDDFARRDGFEDWHAMRLFWEEHHPNVDLFDGLLIRWNDQFIPGQRVLGRWDD